MAEDADREATKVRPLAMADNYEVQAGIENEFTEPKSADAASEANAPTQDEAPTINTGRKITAGLKETPLRSDARPSTTVALIRRGSRQHGQGTAAKWR
jgi:hypothetical protein